MTGVSERQRRFVEFYMGAAAGNATKAALMAGYSPKTARKQGSRLLTKGHIRSAVDQAADNDPLVWDREDRQRFWTAVARGLGEFARASLKDRLKASELLGKSQADFVERRDERMTLEDIMDGVNKLARERAAARLLPAASDAS